MMRPWLLCTALLLVGCDKTPPTVDTEAPATASATSSASPASFVLPKDTYRGAKLHEKVMLSPVWEVDQIYKSMTGPSDVENFLPLEADTPELLWIVGFEATMVSPDGKAPEKQEFMCHTNLDFAETQNHMALFEATKKRLSGRLFTLSQGQHRIDMPEGFGLPILSTEAMSLNTQVLNLNMAEGEKKLRHRVTFRFVRDKELKEPMKALYSAGAYGLKLLDGVDGHYGAEGHGEDSKHGAACLPGENAGRNQFDDHKGRKFTGHWVVKPGREVNHTRVTDIMELPFDTKVHYIAVHLHPFAESLELRDLTAGKTVYKAHTKQLEGGVGLDHVDHFSSKEGIALFKDHEYEIISVYNNTTNQDQDSMAVLNMYLADMEFKMPDLGKAADKAKAAEKPTEDGGKLM